MNSFGKFSPQITHNDHEPLTDLHNPSKLWIKRKENSQSRKGICNDFLYPSE